MNNKQRQFSLVNKDANLTLKFCIYITKYMRRSKFTFEIYVRIFLYSQLIISFAIARSRSSESFELLHRIKFRSVIRGHFMVESFLPNMTNDKLSIGFFKNNDDKNELVGHAPVELSSLLYHAGDVNTVKVAVVGKRKREIVLVIPREHVYYTKTRKTTMVLEN